MRLKTIIFITVFFLSAFSAFSQNSKTDTLPVIDESLAIDTSFDYDSFFSEFDSFLDSLFSPRSYTLVAASAGNSYFNFNKKNNTGVDLRKRLVFSPVVGYYHKSGLGLTLSGNMISDGVKNNLYQYTISPSFDFIQNTKAVAGIAYAHIITKDSLRFYTSPVENILSGYFIIRKPWLQPGLAVAYSWGNRTDYQKRLRYFQRLGITVPIVTATKESASDFSMTATVRHNFYWLNIFSHNDYVRLTPILAFSAASQKFGTDQSTAAYGYNLRNAGTIIYNTPNVNLSSGLPFQPLAATLYIRPEYATKHFFIQPQFVLDYYLPEAEKKFTFLFSLNAGLLF